MKVVIPELRYEEIETKEDLAFPSYYICPICGKRVSPVNDICERCYVLLDWINADVDEDIYYPL